MNAYPKLNDAILDRLNKANELISFIVDIDKKRHNPFLGYKDNEGALTEGKFLFNQYNFLRYQDAYTESYIPLTHEHLYEYCSEGGTGQNLIYQLGEFILTGKCGHLNDYKETWAFPYESTLKVREKALEIGFITTLEYPYILYRGN